MKPVFGIDSTRDSGNDHQDFNESWDIFRVQTLTDEQTAALEKSADDIEKCVKKIELPSALRILKSVIGFCCLIIFVFLLKSLTLVSPSESYHNAGWLFWIFGALIVIFVILQILGVRRKRSVTDDEQNSAVSHFDNIVNTVEIEMDIPTTAKRTDIFMFFYKMQGEEPQIVAPTAMLTGILNQEFKAYADAENLYLFNMSGKYAFPLASLKSIRTVHKGIMMSSWNKDVWIKSKEYKPYKLAMNNFGIIRCKKYHILELECHGEVWGIYYPSYENPTFEELTSLKAEE